MDKRQGEESAFMSLLKKKDAVLFGGLAENKNTEDDFGEKPSDIDMELTYDRMDCIKIYHDEMCQRGFAGLDETTWNDLEMDMVYLRLNHTKSYVGEQYLYHRLHDVNVDKNKLTALKEQTEFYKNNETKRKTLEKGLKGFGKLESSFYLPSFLMNSQNWEIPYTACYYILQFLLLAFVMASVFVAYQFFLGIILIGAINLTVYTLAKMRYEEFLNAAGNLKQLLVFSRFIVESEYKTDLKISDEIVEICNDMQDVSKKLIRWQTRKNYSLSGDVMAELADFLYGITLLELSMFNRVMKAVSGRQEQIMKLYELIGEIDMGISVASFSESVCCYCNPNIGNTAEFNVKNLVHPLIENAVPNDFILKNRALISGANASGKSTFMKALAVNTILAQTIFTCTAGEFSMPKVYVISSMALRDDVVTGDSYYIREAKRIKEMLNRDDKNNKSLIVIDEILKGTNTHERIAASFAILDYFAGTGHYMLVATHDMELVNGMKERYESFYFESRINEEDITFDYHINKGIGGKSNAIALLSVLGYPQEIVESAGRRFDKYNKYGAT